MTSAHPYAACLSLPSINLFLFAFYSQRARKKRAKRLLLYGGDGASEIGAPTKRHVACRLKERTRRFSLSICAVESYRLCAPSSCDASNLQSRLAAPWKRCRWRESWSVIFSFTRTHFIRPLTRLNHSSRCLQIFAQRTHCSQFLSAFYGCFSWAHQRPLSHFSPRFEKLRRCD